MLDDVDHQNHLKPAKTLKMYFGVKMGHHPTTTTKYLRRNISHPQFWTFSMLRVILQATEGLHRHLWDLVARGHGGRSSQDVPQTGPYWKQPPVAHPCVRTFRLN